MPEITWATGTHPQNRVGLHSACAWLVSNSQDNVTVALLPGEAANACHGGEKFIMASYPLVLCVAVFVPDSHSALLILSLYFFSISAKTRRSAAAYGPTVDIPADSNGLSLFQGFILIEDLQN